MARAGISRRTVLKAGGVLLIGVALGGERIGRAAAQTIPDADRFLGKSLAVDRVDAFLAIHADGSVTLFSGKVDMGTGGRIAMRQILGEELDIPLQRITMIEGDTALTPDQGSTSGSYGIARGGAQLRRVAATARQTLLGLAAQRLGARPDDLEIVDGVVRVKNGTASVAYGELIGDRAFSVAVDPKAPLKDPRRFRYIGKSLPRPDVPAKVTGRHRYLNDLTLPGMLHARVIRPVGVGATLRWYEEPVSARDMGALAECRREIRMPIVTGEELYTRFEFREVFERRAADVINPDVCHVGGIEEPRAIAAMAEAYHVVVSPHNYNSTTVGLAATLQVSAAIPNFLITEYFVNFEPRGREVMVSPFRVEDGYIAVPTAPGLGIELREDVLARYAYREHALRTIPTPGDEGP